MNKTVAYEAVVIFEAKQNQLIMHSGSMAQKFHHFVLYFLLRCLKDLILFGWTILYVIYVAMKCLFSCLFPSRPTRNA